VPDLFERLLLLKKSSMFSKVATDDLRLVAQALEEQSFFAGDHIFEINEQGDHLYLLVSGKVGITLDTDTSSNNYISTLGPGDCFGEMNLLAFRIGACAGGHHRTLFGEDPPAGPAAKLPRDQHWYAAQPVAAGA
jgi:hypothetical protein